MFLWDYFYYQSRAQNQAHFLPLTLEMGSWRWVKKSPRQLFNMAGLNVPMYLKGEDMPKDDSSSTEITPTEEVK